jgi:hypothetical protein
VRIMLPATRLSTAAGERVLLQVREPFVKAS